MAIGKLGRRGGTGSLGGLGPPRASGFASRPAPAGFHWEFVTDQGVRVTDQGVPVVDLVAN